MSRRVPGAGSIKDIEQKKREVFKPLLENPFTRGSAWPTVEQSVSDTIMECLMQVLSGYGSYLEMKKLNKTKNLPVHELALKITVNFNSTVKKLEKQAEPNRAKLLNKAALNKGGSTSNSACVKYVFVAKSDISTLLLTSCFPLLVFSASRSNLDRVKLIELPRGASSKILKVLRTDNVSILSLEDDWTEGRILFDVINENISDIEVPWLGGLFDGSSVLVPVFEKPNIKFVRTTAPVGRVDKKNTRKGGIMKKKKNRSNGNKEKEKIQKDKQMQ